MAEKRIEETFRAIAPKVDFCSLRHVKERSEYLSVRRNVVQPVSLGEDEGAMITVIDGGGMGYAGTCALTEQGLRAAAEKALAWAHHSAARSVVDFSPLCHRGAVRGLYTTPVEVSWDSITLKDKIDLLRLECERLKTDDRILDWEAALWHTETQSLYLTVDGGRVRQVLQYIVPILSCTANRGSESETRTFGGRGYCRQGGLEVLKQTGFHEAAPQIAEEALELLEAPNCPSGTMDVLLAPDQMFIQIHESIGHPLELDRILGDERNYAGTSFVTPEMFGHYRYGSELLNVTFDPTRSQEFASYGFDDEGEPAKREYIIQEGLLLRGLGGMTSQMRLGMPGVGNARATSWNRPPIDRMANLNLEPGASSFQEMVQSIGRGVFLETNCSWSIDDSRNKFQFGCERGQLIRNGKLDGVVKKPSYRGLSSTFWRNLKMVGNLETFDLLGSPFCGKGEPNQIIRVGHATPACVISAVEVFGGE